MVSGNDEKAFKEIVGAEPAWKNKFGVQVMKVWTKWPEGYGFFFVAIDGSEYIAAI